MTKPVVCIVCNALDDTTRLQRDIQSDSPAASKKVWSMCHALKHAGIRSYILSMGRGGVDSEKSPKLWGYKVCRVQGITVIYVPYWHKKILTHFLSLIGLTLPLLWLAKHQPRAVLFYNRQPTYLLAMLVSIVCGYRRFLDLEDGDVHRGGLVSMIRRSLLVPLFDWGCKDGALLACQALISQTKIRHNHVFYGVLDFQDMPNSRLTHTDDVICLMSGTLAPSTGALLLVETIKLLRQQAPNWVSKLRFEVTGKGESLLDFEVLEKSDIYPKVRVHGRVSDKEYQDILQRCHIGLSLKPVGGELADTTFPSKIIEFAQHGLLIITTDISDVRSVLADNAIYLQGNNPEELAEHLRALVYDRNKIEHSALQGSSVVAQRLEITKVSHALRDFLGIYEN